MPWGPQDAAKHNKAAKTPAQKKRWAATATSILEKTGDEGKAIRIANAALRRGAVKRKAM